MRLDPINGIRDGLKIDLNSLNSFISTSTTSINTVASKRNDVVDTLSVMDNTTHELPRTMAENVGIVLIGQSNDSTLYLPFAKFLYNTDGLLINHSLFPMIQAFYIVNTSNNAKVTTATGTDNIDLISGTLDKTSDLPFSITYTVASQDTFDTILVTFANDSKMNMQIDYDTVTDSAKVINAFMYKFPYGLKSSSFTFDASMLNGKYTAQIERVIVGNSTLNTSYTASTIPYTALIPNAKYKADLLCTYSKSSSFALNAVNNSNQANILTIEGDVKTTNIVSNHRKSFDASNTLSGGAVTLNSGFDVDESSTYILFGGNDTTYPTKFSFDSNGLMHSFVVVNNTVQIPADLNASFYDIDGNRIYSTLDGGIYEIVYSYTDKGQVLSLFDNSYATKADNDNIAINGSSISVETSTSGVTTNLFDILDHSYVPSGIAYADTTNATYTGDNIEMLGCDVFESTSYTFNGTMLDIKLPVTALANTNSNLTAVVKTNSGYTSVDDGQFIYAENTDSTKYVLCRIDTTKHNDLIDIANATIYAIAAPKYSSDTSTNTSASFKDNQIVYGMVLRGNKDTNINVFVAGNNIYTGKFTEFITLGITKLDDVSIIADKPLGIAFVAPADVQTSVIYSYPIKKLSSITTSASSYSFAFKDTSDNTIATFTQSDTVNLDTNMHPMFKIFTSDVDAIKDAYLTWSYVDPTVYVSTRDFIGYEEETFSLSASFDGVGFVPSATAIIVTSVR